MCYFRESVNNNKNGVPPIFCPNKLKIKSMLMSFQGVQEIGKVVYKP
jgi:hypothetical protein